MHYLNLPTEWRSALWMAFTVLLLLISPVGRLRLYAEAVEDRHERLRTALEDNLYVSGREIFPGLAREDGAVGREGVRFQGQWASATGHASPEATVHPAIQTGSGAVSIVVSYQGTVDWGQTVHLDGGKWWVWNGERGEGALLQGDVEDGSVRWPDGPGKRLTETCGPGVAVVQVYLTGDRFRYFDGCLDDLRPDGPLVPKFWGTLSTQAP